MPRFLVASYLPDDFDPSTITPETGAAIHALNAEMEAAGALKFACGVSPAGSAKTLRNRGGKVLVTDGPYTETKEHIAGFMLVDAANMDEVLAWMRKGDAGMLGPVEVRELYYHPDAEGQISSDKI